jgi:hypothetical protein
MVSIDRAKKNILCYGGYSSAWPEQDRQAMQQQLIDSKSLSDLQKEAINLDRVMGLSEQEDDTSLDWTRVQNCANKIVNRLPEQQQRIKQMPLTYSNNEPLIDKKVRKLFSQKMTVASVFLVVIGMLYSLQISKISDDDKQLSLLESMAIYIDDTSVFDEELIGIDNDEQLEILAFIEPQIMEDYN